MGWGIGFGSGFGSGIGSGSGFGSGCGSTLIGVMGVPQLGQNLMPPGISSPQFGQYMIDSFYVTVVVYFSSNSSPGSGMKMLSQPSLRNCLL